jgi:hypothetical protein
MALVLGTAGVARAGFILEGSLAKGAMVSPDVKAEQTNIMLAPGLTVLSMLRLQVGLAGALPDVKGSKFDLQVRPMVTVSPPLLPLYGRLIFAVTNLRDDAVLAYGGALGLSFELAGLGVFAEAAALPRSVNSQLQWVVEGRAGVGIQF